MERELGGVLLVVAILLLAGCSGAFGAEQGEIVIESEEGQNGQPYVYVSTTAGQLPDDTEVTIEHTLDDVPEASTTLDRPADADVRVYLGGPLGTEALTDFKRGNPPINGLVPPDVAVTVTVTVETGERSATESFEFGEE